MWRIVRGFEIHAAHRIAGHPKCGITHGHSYQLTVRFKFQGWLDFEVLREVVEKSVDFFDHSDLGNMTCEELAEKLQIRLQYEFEEQVPNVKLDDIEIELYETAKFGVLL